MQKQVIKGKAVDTIFVITFAEIMQSDESSSKKMEAMKKLYRCVDKSLKRRKREWQE